MRPGNAPPWTEIRNCELGELELGELCELELISKFELILELYLIAPQFNCAAEFEQTSRPEQYRVCVYIIHTVGP